ncbi:hypothetical protein [Anaeromyxobacter diazotrophicus]|uniref:Uncharacterized protein n=1 Tax=Anaeromyxobacter diazotrophicus TaxID=2590199 RepID=A0A7I9VL49_9BACT|nr:hypothetical protein [Anaeromyxobacter diazotrophicus]GEJ57146.1 hypothetical protein AMYX_18870 [Anaeromyxobacter diazotrophicus]
MRRTSPSSSGPLALDRRRFLAGLGLGGALAAARLGGVARAVESAGKGEVLPAPVGGSAEPSAIPWLDKNGSHNQSPGPRAEPSSIFHFKGRIARANDFEGTGQDGQGNALPWGEPSTDFSFMDGVYWPTTRIERRGTFSHL